MTRRKSLVPQSETTSHFSMQSRPILPHTSLLYITIPSIRIILRKSKSQVDSTKLMNFINPVTGDSRYPRVVCESRRYKSGTI